MQEFFNRILVLNLVGTTIVFAVAAKIYVLPQIGRISSKHILTPILLLHALRNLGMMFLTPGAVYSGLPASFAYPAAFGDLIAAILAFITIPFVQRGSRLFRPLLWIFNVWGTLDLLTAIALATIFNAPLYMGPSYWIPAFWVPTLLVTHYIVFVVLLRKPQS